MQHSEAATKKHSRTRRFLVVQVIVAFEDLIEATGQVLLS